MAVQVVEFSGVSGDIVAGLRRLADKVEAGEFGELQFVTALAVRPSGAFVAFSWGRASLLEAIGAYARAVTCDLVDE